MHSDAYARHASICQTFENSSGSMHAPHHVRVDALRVPESAWPLAWSTRPLDQPHFLFLGFRWRKLIIPRSKSFLRLSITCVKSDKFQPKAPENQSRPLFSKTADPEKRAGQGASAPEGGLSAGAGMGGEKWPGSRHNERASLARMAFERGIYA